MSVANLKILLLLFIPLSSFSQKTVDGIYPEIEEKNCSFNSIRLLNTKTKVCISERPIITTEDFKEISPLESDKKRNVREFSITLSEKGREKLAAISKVYSGKNLAFVTDNQAICLMKIHGAITSGKVIVKEDLGYSALKYIHQKIKEQIDNEK